MKNKENMRNISVSRNDLNFFSRFMWSNNELEMFSKYFEYIKNFLKIEYGIDRINFKNMNFVSDTRIKVKYLVDDEIVESEYEVVPYDFFVKYTRREERFRFLGI